MKRLETVRVLSGILQKKEQQVQTLEDSIRVLRAAIIEVELAEDESVTTPQKGTFKEQTADAIYNLLKEAQTPLHRNVILTKVKERGLIISGGISTIGAYLSMDERFKSVGKGIWTLADTHATGSDEANDDGSTPQRTDDIFKLPPPLLQNGGSKNTPGYPASSEAIIVSPSSTKITARPTGIG